MHYGDDEATAFHRTRRLTEDATLAWRDAIAEHLTAFEGMRVLDLGSGLGEWAEKLSEWFGVDVIGVEPSEAMRARGAYLRTIAADAQALSVPQITAASLAMMAEHMDKDAHTPLRIISDGEYSDGVMRLREESRRNSDPVVD